MEDGTTDVMRVRFPAAADYLRIGRVAIAGLALRLDIDVQRVENLRLAVDAAVEALTGIGEIEVRARWEPGRLAIEIENDAAELPPDKGDELSELLSGLVDHVKVDRDSIDLLLSSAPADS